MDGGPAKTANVALAGVGLRVQKELRMLARAPPPGIAVYSRHGDARTDELDAEIRMPLTASSSTAQAVAKEHSPYAGGVFRIEVLLPPRYPHEPPRVRFQTPVYHPNIDSAGRICLDALRMPPQGSWRPSMNIATLLISVQQLLDAPDVSDPLMPDIASEYTCDRMRFFLNAQRFTHQHAMLSAGVSLAGGDKQPSRCLADASSGRMKFRVVDEKVEPLAKCVNEKSLLKASSAEPSLQIVADSAKQRHESVKLAVGTSLPDATTNSHRYAHDPDLKDTMRKRRRF